MLREEDVVSQGTGRWAYPCLSMNLNLIMSFEILCVLAATKR
jgi:hypothetical protein